MVVSMVIAVRTERGPDGLEVVKEASTDDDRARLADEAAILRRAAHPGVVEVVAATDSVLRLRHCGSPLARLGPIAPDHAAALVRAVAEIVDVLHRQGIVHRRIDADHVVVSERGRPHLIGFGEAGDGDAAEASADVAALGAMLNRLLDEGAEALWSPAHRGVRAATRRRRAMAAFRTAAANAQRVEAGQRPSAHQLAGAIGDALPGLTLPVPPGGGDQATSPGGFAEIPQDIDPTADLGWTDFDLSFLAVDDEVAPDDGVERNPGTPRDHYAVLESLASPDPDDDPGDDAAAPEPEPDPDPDPIIAALRAAIAAESDTGTGTETEFDFQFEAETDVEAETDIEAGTDVGFGTEPGTGTEPPTEVDTPPAAPEPVVDPASAMTAMAAPPPAAEPEPIRLRPPSIEIRPGGADPTDDPGGPSRRVLVVVAIVVLVLGAIAGSVIARAIDPFGAESASAAPDATTPSTADSSDDRATTPPPLPDGCTAVALAGPDGDNDGCPDEVRLDGRVATVGEIDVELGQDGDVAVVADSDCDGVATPVVLRPETGEVFAFPDWSLDEPVEVAASTVVDDAVSLTTESGDCPRVLVTTAAGDEIAVAP